MENSKTETTLEDRVSQLEKSFSDLIQQTINLTIEYNKTLETISGIQSQIMILRGRPQ